MRSGEVCVAATSPRSTSNAFFGKADVLLCEIRVLLHSLFSSKSLENLDTKHADSASPPPLSRLLHSGSGNILAGSVLCAFNCG